MSWGNHRRRWPSARVGRGFSLIELAVAMALTGILTVAVLSTFSMIGRYRMRLQLMAAVDDVAKLITAYVTGEIRRAGGATLKPWQAIGVRDCDNPAAYSDDIRCQFGDSLTLAFFDDESAVTTCKITGGVFSNSSDVGTFQVERISGDSDNDDDIEVEPPPGETACCNLLRTVNGEDETVIKTDLVNRHVVMIRGNQHITLTYSVGSSTGTTGHCGFDWQVSGAARSLVSGNLLGALTTPAEVFGTGEDVYIVPTMLATLFVGCPLKPNNRPSNCTPAERSLYLFSDSDPGYPTPPATLAFDPNVDHFELLGSGVVDMRIRLGFDWDLSGHIDEPFFGNSPSGPEWVQQADTVAQDLNVLVDRMRMVQVSLVAGGPTHDPNYINSAQALDSPKVFKRKGSYFTNGYSRAAMKSLASFR